jgi:hypothetical protein
VSVVTMSALADRVPRARVARTADPIAHLRAVRQRAPPIRTRPLPQTAGTEPWISVAGRGRR